MMPPASGPIDPLTIDAARTNGATTDATRTNGTTTDDATSIDPLTIDAAGVGDEELVGV